MEPPIFIRLESKIFHPANWMISNIKKKLQKKVDISPKDIASKKCTHDIAHVKGDFIV